MDNPVGSQGAAVAHRAVRGSVWIGASSFVGFAMNIAGTAVLARFISPAEFGAYALAQSYNQIALAATSFAFTQAVVQASGPMPALADTALLMTAAVRVLLLFAAIPIAFALRGWHGDTVGWMFGLLAAWQLVEAIKTAMGITLERDMHFGRIAALSLFGSAAATAISVFVAVSRPGPYALVVRDIAASTIVLIAYVLLAARWRLPIGRAFDWGTARYLWRFGKNMYVVRALEQLVARLDRPLIGSTVSLEALGFYHQSRYVASLPAVAVAPGNLRVAVATYSRLRGDHDRTTRAFDLVQYFVVRSVAPFAVLCFVWPREILVLAFGARWAGAADALRILGLFAVTYPALESYRALLTAAEQWSALRRSILLQGTLLVSTFALAAPRWGAAGAAGAALTATAGGLLYSRHAARAIVGLPSTRSMVPVVGATSFAVITGLALKQGLGQPSVRHLVTGALLAVGTYAVALLLLERARIASNVGRVLDLIRSRRGSQRPVGERGTGAFDAG